MQPGIIILLFADELAVFNINGYGRIRVKVAGENLSRDEGLMKERRGRAGAASGTKKGRPPKLDRKVEEDLIAENQRLRMEIEYLKKLSALVLAEEQKSGKRR